MAFVPAERHLGRGRIAARPRLAILGRRSARAIVRLLVPAILVAAWWIASANSTSPYLPPLSESLSAGWHTWASSSFVTDAVPSLVHLGVGLLLAGVIGVALGVVLGRLRLLGEIVWPVLEGARATPAVALVPAAIVLFGIGASTQIVIIAAATVWPILLNTIDGVRAVEPVVEDLMVSYRIRTVDRVLRVVLPAAGPQIMAGMNTAIAIGVVMIVFSEMQGATDGIGYMLLQQQRSYDIAGMWGTVIFFGLLGFTLNWSFQRIERRVVRWHYARRAQQP
jgi:ABC-type nitrate/sulfonate/bicarbonate transport system permease component